MPPLKTELLHWSYPEEKKKNKRKQFAQTKRKQASVYVSEIESRIVYSEQREKKQEEGRAEWAEKGATLEKRRKKKKEK